MKKLPVLILIIIISSCEEVFIDADPKNDPVANFDFLWSELDQKYSFFDFKKIDWDSVYNVYRPQVTSSTPREELFNVIANMLNTLRDGHVNLRSEFNISKYENWFLDYPANFEREMILYYYLGNDYKITGPLLHKEIDGVGYVRYGSFQSIIDEGDLDYVLTTYKNSKGIIIDIRGNEGGDPANGFKILERIVKDRKIIYRHAFKNGPGHNDFEPFKDVYLEPDMEKIRYDKKVVVLTNRLVYSAANYFSAICRVYGIMLVGDQTGGGGGAPAGSELPNGFHVNYSSSVCLLPDGYNIEDGIPPDIKVDITDEDKLNNIDTIIETAIDQF
jgi:hypothetical protein